MEPVFGLVCMASKLKKLARLFFLPITLLLLLVLSLSSLAGLLLNASAFAEWHIRLLGFNVFLLLMFVGFIARHIWRLKQNIARKEAGARLTKRLTVYFTIFALLPASVVYFFSVWSLQQGIDAWLNADVERGLEDALVLGRLSLETQLDHYHKQTEPALAELANTPNELASYALHKLLNESDADEMTLFDGNQQIIASASKDMNRPLADFPASSILQALDEGVPYIGLEPSAGKNLYARLVFVLPPYEALSEERVFQALFPASERVSALASNVQTVYRDYRQLIYGSDMLRTHLAVLLALALLSGIAYAVWLSFALAGRLIKPIATLSSATRAVASGQLDLQIESFPRDDLGQLVDSFNAMTARLAKTRESMEKGRQQLAREHAYIRTVLEQVSSGVLSLDKDLRLVTCNQAAGDMFRMPLAMFADKPLAVAARQSTVVNALCGWLQTAHADEEKTEWEHQFNGFLDNEYTTFIFRIANLPDGGYVVVCNDVTQVVQAQRNKAWAEAAQRMAHEIKNPLTPIQLASERLGKKLRDDLDARQQELLARCTQTIINQVEGMRAMLDEFSQYAKSDTRLTFSPISINALVNEVGELYRNGPARLIFQLATRQPRVLGDASRLRQLLHNLLKNANEAFTPESVSPCVKIKTSVKEGNELKLDQVVLEISDNGPGFDREVIEHLFDPYMTTKRGGNGLGLAIVNKIVDEHGGSIQVQNARSGGASITISLIKARENGHTADGSKNTAEA